MTTQFGEVLIHDVPQSISTANCAKMSCSHSMEKSMSASCDVKAQIAKLEMQAAKC